MYCISYVIQRGDTLYSISRKFQVGISEIMKANPLVDVYNLTVDTVICVPINTETGRSHYSDVTTYNVQEGDTLKSILENSDNGIADFLALNDLNEIILRPGSTVKLAMHEEIENNLNGIDE
ncbi:MAG: LysM peptidoglycan-binding domain-containing protein [Mobilitalea sp.]